MKRVVVVSDLQVPYHSKAAVRSLAKFIREWGPDDVYCVGDVLDAPQVSQWTRGQAGEYEGTLGKHRDQAVQILEELQIKHLSRSNHDDRVELYLERKAFGLLGLKELRTEAFLRLDELGITFHRKPWQFAPGWFLAHGDEGGLSQDAGKTALNLAKKFSASVVIGHTHRMGIVHDTDSINGKVIRTKVGFETGCLMDLSQADYIRKQGGAANWQLGFGVLYIDGPTVAPVPVFMEPNGQFVFEGRRWK